MEECRYYGSCQHLEVYNNDIKSDKCLKNYYKIYDVSKNKSFHVAVCNQYIKLRISQISHHNFINAAGYNRSKEIEFDLFIKDMCKHYLPNNLGIGYARLAYKPNAPLLSRAFTYAVMTKPYVYSTITIQEALSIFIDNGFHWNNETGFKDNLLYRLRIVCNEMLGFAKYKKSYGIINSALNGIKKSNNGTYFIDERGMDVNKLLIELNEIFIKNNV